MKHIFKYFTAAALASAMALTGCNDFLDVKPLNEIVFENYWTEKADVESVVYGCYSGMQDNEFLYRTFLWGEVRSDNVTTSRSTQEPLRQIVGENILETNNWLKWQHFYQVINRCNTVIRFAPEVAEKDPNYTPSEMKAHVAEATWIRTLCYFYLARTFRDVPYTSNPSLDDNNIEEDYRIPPMPFNQLLKQITADLEAVKGDALKLYPVEPQTGKAANTSRVTTCAMYALLADLYLWQDEFEKCIECTQFVLDYKRERYDEMYEEDPKSVDNIDLINDKYMLISECPSGDIIGTAYNSIFGVGNSFESIFELYYERQLSPENALVSSYFGNTRDVVGQFTAYEKIYEGTYDGNGLLFDATDYRLAENIKEDNMLFPIRKYYYQNVSIKKSTASGTPPTVTPISRSQNYANWIFYRLTDVMLMRAEALVELGSEENLKEAFEIVSVIYNRANILKDGDSKCLKYEDYATQLDMRQLVNDERRRELMFEGKRWFDLVRYALRDGNNDALINTVIGKQKERPSAVKVQLQSQNALFWPYFKTEVEVNKHLHQNEAYIKNETSQK